jgi:protein-L-isoaspartate O-methyltransferase
MVARLQAEGSVRSPEVAAAFATVPREMFAPEASFLTAAYDAREIVVTKRDAALRISSARQLRTNAVQATGLVAIVAVQTHVSLA